MRPYRLEAPLKEGPLLIGALELPQKYVWRPQASAAVASAVVALVAVAASTPERSLLPRLPRSPGCSVAYVFLVFVARLLLPYGSKVPSYRVYRVYILGIVMMVSGRFLMVSLIVGCLDA